MRTIDCSHNGRPRRGRVALARIIIAAPGVKLAPLPLTSSARSACHGHASRSARDPTFPSTCDLSAPADLTFGRGGDGGSTEARAFHVHIDYKQVGDFRVGQARKLGADLIEDELDMGASYWVSYCARKASDVSERMNERRKLYWSFWMDSTRCLEGIHQNFRIEAPSMRPLAAYGRFL